MAIFQRAYQGYHGEVSAPFARTLVIFRYALADAFASKLFVAYFAICFLPSLVLMILLYTYHNIDLLVQFEVDLDDLVAINGEFFFYSMQIPQTVMLLFLVIAIGPAMISPDIRNNAMPLYLSRPISKTSYILGKLMVLLLLGSLISWVPGVMLLLMQAFLQPGWLADNYYLFTASIVTSLTWLLTLALLSFAVSAFVKWKAVARMVFFGVIFLGSALGETIQQIFGGWASNVVNITAALNVMMRDMFGLLGGMDYLEIIPLWGAFVIFGTVCLICLFLLSRRIRAFQVVS